MKVLHVIPGIADRTGGPAVAVLQSSRLLSEYGITSTVATTDLGEAASAGSYTRITCQASFIPREVDVRMHPVQPPRRVAYSRLLGRALRKMVHEYDVGHIHSPFLF